MDKNEIARRGEDAAVAYLERSGMTVLERNWRCPAGELDVVAEDGDTLVLVEVKTRRSERAGSPEEAVSQTKRKRIARLAAAYIATTHRAESPVRFDVVGIRVMSENRALLRHHRGAFEVGA